MRWWPLLRHPIFYLQVAHVCFMLRFVRSPQFYLCMAVGGLIYLVVLRFFTSNSYIRWQRRTCDSIRRVLAETFKLKRLTGIQKDDWDSLEGALRFSKASVILCLILMAIYVFEGKYVGGFNLFFNSLFFLMASRSNCKEVILFTGRFSAILQLVSAASFGGAFGPNAVRRMLVTRALFTLAYTESVPEIFASVVVLPCCYMAFRFGYDSPILLIPVIHFFVTVLPIEVMGLRLWLLRKAHETKYVSPSTYVAMVIMIVPMTIAVASFSMGLSSDLLLLDAMATSPNENNRAMPQTAINQESSIPYLIIRSFPVIGLILASTWHFWATPVDTWIESMSTNPGMARTRRVNVMMVVDDDKFDVIMAAWMTTLVILALFTEPFTIVPGVMMIVFSHRLSGDHDVERLGLLTFHMWMSLYVSAFDQDDLHLLLTGSRLWLYFEDRAFSDILAEATFVSSFQVLFEPNIMVRKAVFGIFACGLIVGLSLRLIRNNVDRFMNEVKAADSFLDHALKQRLAAMSLVMQHAMEVSWKVMSSSLRHTISQATFETQLALAACHLSSAALRYESGSFMNTESGKPQRVMAMIRNWKEEHAFFSVVPVEGDEWIEANLNYDLLHYLMADMMRPYIMQCLDVLEHYRNYGPEAANPPSTVPVRIIVQRSGPQTFVIKLDAPHSSELGPKQELLLSIRESVASALDGKLGSLGNSIEFRLAHSDFLMAHHSSQSSNSSSSDLIPTTSTSSQATTQTVQSTTTAGVTSPEFTSSRQPMHLDKSNLPISPLHLPSSKDHEQISSRELPGFELGSSLPKSLAIAVLDDNNLVRKSLMFTIKMHMKANMDKSFAMGITKEEALQFPAIITEKDVQIALFDENLEYDEGETLKGTTLAARARKLGFRGCLILHSANSALEETLDPCFDGFVEKTESREQFLRHISQIYERYLMKVMYSGHKNSPVRKSPSPSQSKKNG